MSCWVNKNKNHITITKIYRKYSTYNLATKYPPKIPKTKEYGTEAKNLLLRTDFKF
jgi:uncharacterized Fe-S cluster-containing radical SAM superfamily enzyme